MPAPDVKLDLEQLLRDVAALQAALGETGLHRFCAYAGAAQRLEAALAGCRWVRLEIVGGRNGEVEISCCTADGKFQCGRGLDLPDAARHVGAQEGKVCKGEVCRGQWRPLTAFYRDKNRAGGLSLHCARCESVRLKRLRARKRGAGSTKYEGRSTKD